MLTSPTNTNSGGRSTPLSLETNVDRAEEFWNSFQSKKDPSSPSSTFLSLSSGIENLPVDELRNSPFLLMVWLAYLESHQTRFPASEGEEEVRRLFKLLKSEQVGGPGLGRVLLTLHYAHFEWISGKLSKALQLMNDKSLLNLSSYAPSPLIPFLPLRIEEIAEIRLRIQRIQIEDSTIVPCDFRLPSLILTLLPPESNRGGESKLTEQTLQRLRKLGISSSSSSSTILTEQTSSPLPPPLQPSPLSPPPPPLKKGSIADFSLKKREIPQPSPIKEIPNSPLIKGPLSKQAYKSSMDNVFEHLENNDNDMSLTNPEIRESLDHTPLTGNTLLHITDSQHQYISPQQQQQQQTQPKHRSIKVNGQTYKILSLVGRGGSSRVFKVLSVQSNQILALKKVSLRGLDPITLQGYMNEINLLSSFKECSNIIHLIDYEINHQPSPGSLLILMEYGEADLGKLLQSPRRRRSGMVVSSSVMNNGIGNEEQDLETQRFPPIADERGSYRDLNFIRHLWQQMLLAVETVHQAKIVHCDLKPANFLLVNGMVKLIDFGISKAILTDNTTTVMRENQVGTVNYMSPEALEENNNTNLGGMMMNHLQHKKIKIGRSSDVWSLGCILYEMIYGRPPFAQYTLIQRLQKILDPHHIIEYPPCLENSIIDVIKMCLRRDPKRRPSIQELLLDPFLVPSVRAVTTTPFPKHSSSFTTTKDTVLIKREQLEEVLEQFAKHLPPGQQLDAKGLVTKLFEQWKRGGGGGG